MSGTKSLTLVIGPGIQAGVYALFGGHHAVWASPLFQADVCNNADDLVVLDCLTGRKHRFPITKAFLPWLTKLLEVMNAYDQLSESPWSEHNAGVRAIFLDAAARVLKDDPPQLNILQPPLVAPAVDAGPSEVDAMLRQLIGEHPESLIV
jgi:hypothetical protein